MYTREQVIKILEICGFDCDEAIEILNNLPFCYFDNCNDLATWEGWYKFSDSLNRRVNVCDVHKSELIGSKK